jgi:uncharacterized membrane protein YfcA
MDFGTAAIVAATFLLAGMVKGITGMGLPTVAMAVLGTLLSPVVAAAMLVVPTFITNIWQMVVGPSLGALVARLWLMMICITLGTLLGAWMLTSGSADGTMLALGVILSVYAIASLLKWELTIPPRLERRLSPVIGLVTGVIGGSTAVFAIPVAPYLQGLGLGKDELVQALGLSFTVSTISLAIGLGWGGAFNVGMAGASALGVVTALIGMTLGKHLRDRIEPATFRRWFLIGLLVIGAQLILRAGLAMA